MSPADSGGTLRGLTALGPPLHIGRYEIVGRLATGGMAEVYLARHGEISGFKTLVVVKRILPHLASDPQFIEMFLDEARIVARLDHPNVVRIIEVGRSGSEYFLAMDLVQGESLAEVFHRGVASGKPMAPPQSAFAIAHAAAGLHHAHTMHDVAGKPLSIVHRDVSPQNVLTSFEGAVKVIDFGVARALGRVSHTNTGGVKGKFGYMSPEQASGLIVDARADIFALGVIFWEALTSRRLFKRESDLATLRAIVDEPYPRPLDFAQVPPALDAIVMRALEKDREKRFASGAEMQTALEAWLYAEGGRAGAAELGRYVKELLPDRHERWKEAVRVALEKGDRPGDLAQQALLGTPSASGRRSARRGGAETPSASETSGINTVYEKGISAETSLPRRGLRRIPRRARFAAAGVGVLALGAVAFFIINGDSPAPPLPALDSKAAPAIQPLPAAPSGSGQEPVRGSPVPSPVPVSVAQLFVTVTPKDSRVFVDGILKAERTPTVLEVPPGTVEVRIEHEGYEPYIETLDLPGGRQKLLDQTLKAKPAKSTKSSKPSASRPSRPSKKPAKAAAHPKAPKRPAGTKPNPFD